MHIKNFSKKNYSNALEVAYFCISDHYSDDMTFKEFKAQLKKDRESGLLELSGFKVDLRSNKLIDIMDDIDD